MRYRDDRRWRRGLRKAGDLLRKVPANDRGVALILAITTLVVLTVVGVAALINTGVELKVSQGEKVFNIAFYNASAGEDVAAEVLEEALYLRGLSSGSYKGSSEVTINDSGFWDEPEVSPGTGPWPAWPRYYYNDQTSTIVLDADPSNDEDSATYKDLSLSLTLGNGVTATADMDVDYLRFQVQEGGSLLQGMGYEGMGKGIAGGGAKRIYGIASRGDGPANTGGRVRIYVTYDHII